MDKKILYIDMDNTLVDFDGGMDAVPEEVKATLPYNEKWHDLSFDLLPGYFASLQPMQGAMEAVRQLYDSGRFDMYLLSASPWNNASAAMEKQEWVRRYFGEGKDSIFYERLILSFHKHLSMGDYLIDDSTNNGAGRFSGELIQFGSERFPNWPTIVKYLLEQEGAKV